MNGVAEELTEWNENEAIGELLSNVFKIIDEKTRKNIEIPIKDLIKEAEISNFSENSILITKNGKKLSIEENGTPIKDVEGNVKGFVLIFRSIGDKEKAQIQLLDKFNELDKILRGVTDTVARFDKNLRHLYINPIVEKELGLSREFFIGKTNREIGMPEDVVVGWEKALRKVFNTGKEIRYEVSYPSSDGGMDYYENKIIPEFNQENQVESVITITRNITQRKLAEKNLIESVERLNFYKDLLAHDMANVLNNIKISMDLLDNWDKKPLNSDKMKQTKELIMDQLDRGASLISNVRKVSEMENNQFDNIEPIDICNLLNEVIEGVKNRFKKKRIIINRNFSNSDVLISAGRLLLYAFENILLNSIFHNDNKEISLWIDMSLVIKDGKSCAKIEFKDNGIGIQDDRKEIIFQRKYERGKSTGGMGIGLSIVKKIIESYGGKIEVKNRIKDNYSLGSNFVVYLKTS